MTLGGVGSIPTGGRLPCGQHWSTCTPKKTASNEIESALFELSRIGLYVEPTSIPAAAFTKLLDRRVVQPSETTVLVLTGAGLKTIGELMGAQPTR
jgi:threonine synthase